MLTRMIVILSLTLAILFNGAVAFIPFSGPSMSEIVHRLPILIMPSAFTFSIRFIILLLFIGWAYSFCKRDLTIRRSLMNRRATLFVLMNVVQAIYLFLWHNERYVESVFALIILLFIIYFFYRTYQHDQIGFERLAVGVAFGWTFLLVIFDIAYVLTLNSWSGWGLSDPLWAVIMLTVSTAFALHFTYHYNDRTMGYVYIWTFIGVACKNGFDELFVTVAALFLTAVIVGALLLQKEQNASRR
ncbi:hypothetical protein GOP80_11445 [Planococcaceae bacterium Storch 2/2-2]|nr:hypothetical protein [Planococcaceae bacterium Storch 2/2-2]